MTHVGSTLTDLYIGSWSPAHDNLCHFKVSGISSSGVGTSNTFEVDVNLIEAQYAQTWSTKAKPAWT
jgi:hypothetical protein